MRKYVVRDVWGERPEGWLRRAASWVRRRLRRAIPVDYEATVQANHGLYQRLSKADKLRASALREGRLKYIHTMPPCEEPSEE